MDDLYDKEEGKEQQGKIKKKKFKMQLNFHLI